MIPIDKSLKEISSEFYSDHSKETGQSKGKKTDQSKEISWSKLTSLFETRKSSEDIFDFYVGKHQYYVYMSDKSIVIDAHDSHKMTLDEGLRDSVLVDKSLSTTTEKIKLLQHLYKSLEKPASISISDDSSISPKKPTDTVSVASTKLSSSAPSTIVDKEKGVIQSSLGRVKKLSWKDIPDSIIFVFFTWVDIQDWSRLSRTSTMNKKMGQDTRIIASLLNTNVMISGKIFERLFERAHPGSLERLNFYYVKMTKEELEKNLLKYPNVKQIDLTGTDIVFTAEIAAKLPKNLRLINLGGCKLTAEGIANLPKGLRSLNLSDQEITQEIIDNFPKGLVSLTMFRCRNISEIDLSQLSELRSVNIQDSTISEELIAGLPEKLESLVVSGELTEGMIDKLPKGLTSLQVDGLTPRMIRKLPQSLTSLVFIGELTFKMIDRLPENLTSIEFFCPEKPNERVIALIEKLPLIKYLKLRPRSQPLTDKGLIKSLKQEKIAYTLEK